MAKISNLKIRIGILSFSLFMMGAIGMSSALAVIGAHFNNVPQTQIQMIISIPTFVIIFASILAGKMQEFMPKKYIVLIGTVLFIVGGLAPAFMKTFTPILVMRVIVGIGVGLFQPMSSAIIEENFTGHDRERMMGLQSSAQMVGMSAMSFLCGWLATKGWDKAFYWHILGLIPLICVPFMLPAVKPIKKVLSEKSHKEVKPKVKITKGAIAWAVMQFFTFVAAQVNAIYMAYFVVEMNLGDSAMAGRTGIISSVGGFLVGLAFARIRRMTKRFAFSLGLVLLLIADIIFLNANGELMIWIGTFFGGSAFALFIPLIIMNAAAEVDPYSKPMAISIATCTKSVAQFACPYIVGFFGLFFDRERPSRGVFMFTIVYLIALLAIALVWAIIQTIGDRKKAKQQIEQTE